MAEKTVGPGINAVPVRGLARMLAITGLGPGQDHAVGRFGAPSLHHLGRHIGMKLQSISVADTKGLIGEQLAPGQMLYGIGQCETFTMPLIKMLLIIEQTLTRRRRRYFVVADLVKPLRVAFNRTA